MFTGLVEEVGKINSVIKGGNCAILSIKCSSILDDVKEGDSIAVNGVCLTATEIKNDGFTADVMHETLNRSSLGALQQGSKVNLERAMLMGGRFGGHIVSGHIDGTGTIKKMTKDANAYWYRVECSSEILRYIIIKGSITIDGISLTVAEVNDTGFSVSVIPHTLKMTALADKKIGDIVNLENDCIAKYTEKLLFSEPKQEETSSSGGITREFLLENGF